MDKTTFDTGMALRREILSDEHVDRSMANTDEFSAPFQDLVTEFCWGVSWANTDLDRKTRSILTLGMLAAQGRFQEFETHFRAAMRNGATKDELRAAITHIGIYCGMPSAVECLRSAKKVMAAMDT